MGAHTILFTGPAGAGKSTAIAAISETTPVHRTQGDCAGLDVGTLTLGQAGQLALLGTPGEASFDFRWKGLAHDALGVVILLDNSRPDPLLDLRLYLEGFAEELERVPCTIGVGRLSGHPEPSVDDYAASLAELGLALPVLDVDVRERDDVLMLLDSLLAQMEADLLDRTG